MSDQSSQTPNHILPKLKTFPFAAIDNLSQHVSYPRDSRHTLQWLDTTDMDETSLAAVAPNNSDATFIKEAGLTIRSFITLYLRSCSGKKLGGW